MKLTTLLAASVACLGMAGAASAADQLCGANTGAAATGAPIKVGGIYGNAAPGDFSRFDHRGSAPISTASTPMVASMAARSSI